MWGIDRKSLDKNEVENLTNLVEVKLFKVFFEITYIKTMCLKVYVTWVFYVVLAPCHV